MWLSWEFSLHADFRDVPLFIPLDSVKQEQFEPPDSSTVTSLTSDLAFSSKSAINFSSDKHLSSRTELPQPPNSFGGQGMLPLLFTLHRVKQ
jgi:hypothetical protein